MSQAPQNAAPPAKPIRVGLVAGPTSMHALGPVVRHLIVSLLDQPTPVTLVCPADAEAEYLPETLVQIIRYRPARLPFFRGRWLGALVEGIAQAHPSLLHALDTDALALTRHLATKANVEYLAGVYSLGRYARAFDERCQGLLAASEPIRRHLLESRAAPADMIHLLRPGVHQARNATCFIDPNHAVAIVAAGELDSFPVFSAVLEAFAQLREARRECVFFLVGNGRAEAHLRGLAKKMGLMTDLTFVDRTGPEELTGILKAADIFISPRPSRRVEIDLLAAMAGGVPVIAAAGGPADFIIPDQTALTFPAGEAAELTVKLKALLDDRAAARALAENALAHLRESHSPANMCKQLIEIYRNVVNAVRAEV
jgi:glycosyltransferase involved in cell wall biosynthesis